MKRAGLYIRVSTLEQAQEGYSIGEQEKRLVAFCQAHDWAVAGTYVDGGYTGSNLNRPGIQKLIAEIDKLDVVLVYKLDRLSRSQKDTLYLIEEVFLPNGVDFVSINESFDTGTPFGRAMIGILSVFAQLEREQIKERTQMGRIARVKQGLYFGGGRIPTGYDYNGQTLVVNEYEAAQIRKIFDWYIDGMSPEKIAERLHQEGYTNKHNDWDTEGATLLHILSNDVYLGATHYGDLVMENTHEAIITPEQFEKAQQMHEKRHKIYGDTAYVSKYLLTGMIFCGRCGARYSVKMAYKDYRYYCCYSRSKNKRSMAKAEWCGNKNWRTDELEAAVEARVEKLLYTKGEYERLMKSQEKQRNKAKNQNTEADAIKKRIENCDKKIDKLMELYTNDGIHADDLTARIDKIYQEKVRYSEQLEKIEPQVPKKDFDAESVPEMLEHFADVWKAADQSEKRLILEALIDRIVLDGDKITIEWSFLG